MKRGQKCAARSASIIGVVALFSVTFASALRADDNQSASCHATTYATEEETQTTRARWEVVRSELDATQEDEWAGDYAASDNFTTDTYFAWAPASGFIVLREGCYPLPTDVNYGSAAMVDGVLKLSPVLSMKRRSSNGIALEFFPVKWGERHYLIPTDRVIEFCHAINSKAYEDLASYLLKQSDVKKAIKGRPDVPDQFKKYLGLKTIKTKIIATYDGAAKIIDSFGNTEIEKMVTLDVGSAQGVWPGMKFYNPRPKKIFAVLQVVRADERTSEARVVAAFEPEGGQDVIPAAGWKFSTRYRSTMYEP